MVDEIGDKEGIAVSHHGIAQLLNSIAIREQMSDKAGQADSLGEIGKLLFLAGQLKEALKCFLEKY